MEAPVILIVDDEKNIRETVAQALAPAARRIVQAMDAQAALAALAEEDIDVLFLDLRLPDRSGMDVLRTVQLAHPDIVVIVMTAYGDVETAVEAMRFGAMDFLRKPFSPTVLRQSLAAAMATRARVADHMGLAHLLEGARESIRVRALPAAEEQLRAALATAPMNAAVFNLLGVVRELDNRSLDAQIFYRLATTVDMHYEPARANLDRLATWPHTGSIELGTGGSDNASHA